MNINIRILYITTAILIILSGCSKEQPKEWVWIENQESWMTRLPRTQIEESVDDTMFICNSTDVYQNFLKTVGISETPIQFNPDSSSLVIIGRFTRDNVTESAARIYQSILAPKIRVCFDYTYVKPVDNTLIYEVTIGRIPKVSSTTKIEYVCQSPSY